MYYDLKKIIVCLHIFKISHFTIIDQYTCNVCMTPDSSKCQLSCTAVIGITPVSPDLSNTERLKLLLTPSRAYVSLMHQVPGKSNFM